MLDEIRRREIKKVLAARKVFTKAVIEFIVENGNLLDSRDYLSRGGDFVDDSIEKMAFRDMELVVGKSCKAIEKQIVGRLYREAITCENNGNQNTDGVQDAEENAE